MNKVEQEIKRRLAQSTSTEGIDTEGLWASISEASHSVGEPKKKRRFGYIWFLLALILAGSGWAVFANKERTASSYIPRSEDQIEIGNVFLSEITSEQESIASISGALGEETPDIAAIKHLDDGNLLNKANLDVNQRTIEGQEPSNEMANRHLNSGVIAKQNEQANEKVPGKTKTTSNLQETAAVTPINSDDVKQKNVIMPENLIDVYSTTTEPKLFDQNLRSLALIGVGSVALYNTNFKAPFLQKRDLPSSKTPITWTIYGGAVISNVNYLAEGSGLADSLNRNLSPNLGFHFGGLVQIKKQKNWNLSLGIEHMRWNERFDKVITSDTVVFINQQELSAVNFRTVKHYNNSSVLAFPIQLELFKDIERFRIGMSFGASYSLILGQEGRLLKDNITVVNYSQDEKRYSNFFSARVAPSIGYKLNGRIRLNAFCTFGIQEHGSTSINQLNSRSVAVMPSIGITFN